MLERIYISEIQTELKYRDRRSVRRWCRLNNIRLLSDNGSNRQFTIKEEFEKAMNKSCFSNARAIDLNKGFYSMYQKGKREKRGEYQPQGEYEKTFLSILQTLSAQV